VFSTIMKMSNDTKYDRENKSKKNIYIHIPLRTKFNCLCTFMSTVRPQDLLKIQRFKKEKNAHALV